MHKIERLMAIILALNKNNKMTAKELADKFEVGIRTIYRDIQALSEMNIPIVAQVGHEGGYYLLSEYFIPPVMFNKDEVFALLLSQKVIREIDIPGYSQYIESAFLKIEGVIGDKYKESLDSIKKRVKFEKRSKVICKKELKFFEIIKDALENNKKIKVRYFKCEILKNIEIIIRPYGLILVDEEWKVVFSPEDDSKIEAISINMINKAELVEGTFIVPESFNIDEYYCENYCVIKCNKERLEYVKLKVSKSDYYNIKDYIFFKEDNCENKSHIALYEDDVDEAYPYYVLSIKTNNPLIYIPLAFRFYDTIEILEPLWLREKFKLEIEKLYKNYK